MKREPSLWQKMLPLDVDMKDSGDNIKVELFCYSWSTDGNYTDVYIQYTCVLQVCKIIHIW